MGIGIKVEFGKGLVLEATKTDINRFVTALKAVETLILPIGTVHPKLGAAGKQAQAGLAEIIALLGGTPEEAASTADAAPPVDEAADLGETEVASGTDGEEVDYEDGELGEPGEGAEAAEEPAAEGDDDSIVDTDLGTDGEEFAEFDDIDVDGAMDLGDDEPAAEEAALEPEPAPAPAKPAAKPAAAKAPAAAPAPAAAAPSASAGLLARKQALLAKQGKK